MVVFWSAAGAGFGWMGLKHGCGMELLEGDRALCRKLAQWGHATVVVTMLTAVIRRCCHLASRSVGTKCIPRCWQAVSVALKHAQCLVQVTVLG